MATESMDFRQEIFRKIIHLSGLVIPAGYAAFGKPEILAILLPLTITIVAIDFLATVVD